VFNSCIYEFVGEQSCAGHHCVRGCDHGADVAGRKRDCSCLVTVSVTGRDGHETLKPETETRRRCVSRPSRDRDVETETTSLVTDDVDCLKRDGEAHLRRGSQQLGSLADSNQREFGVLTIPRCAGGRPGW